MRRRYSITAPGRATRRVGGDRRVLETALPHLARDAVVVNVSGRMGSIGRVMAGLGASPRRLASSTAMTAAAAEHDDGVRRGGVQGEG